MSSDPEPLIREPLGVYGWVHEGFRFVWLWFVTRSFWMLLRALPALAVMVAIPVLALTEQTSASRESLRKTYLRAAIDAAQEQDFAAAQLWNRKLLTINSADREAQFRLALAVEGGGDVARGRALLKKLTPADANGFVPAHLYCAAQTMLDATQASPDELRTAAWHLAKILSQEPENLEAREMLVRLQIHRGELEDAASHLSQIVVKRPDLHLLLAGLYAKLSMGDAAEKAANRLRVYFEHQRDQHPDDLKPLLQLVEAYIVMHDFATAERLLFDHLKKQLDVEQTKLALLKLAFVEIDVELKRKPPNWRRVITLLERSLGEFPAHEYVFARVALVVGRFQGAAADPLRQILEDALADGRAPAVCHLLLGTMLGVSGKIDEAVKHLSAAQQEFPNNPVVLNNLAWYLMQSDPPQLDQALTCVELAVATAPRVLEIRETRGRILALLGRPADALPDLEAALDMRTVDAGLHTALADVYQQLGNPEMAVRHRQGAAEKAKQ